MTRHHRRQGRSARPEIDDADRDRCPPRSSRQMMFGEWKSRRTRLFSASSSRSNRRLPGRAERAPFRPRSPGDPPQRADTSRSELGLDRHGAAIVSRHVIGFAARQSGDVAGQSRSCRAASIRRRRGSVRAIGVPSGVEHDVAAEILDQKQPGIEIGGADLRRAEALRAQAPRRWRRRAARIRPDARSGCRACRRGSAVRRAGAARSSEFVRAVAVDGLVGAGRGIACQIAARGALATPALSRNRADGEACGRTARRPRRGRRSSSAGPSLLPRSFT